MSEPTRLELEVTGTPVTVCDAEGKPRDLTAWGMAVAPGAVALILTDGQPPTVEQLRDLGSRLTDQPADAP